MKQKLQELLENFDRDTNFFESSDPRPVTQGEMHTLCSSISAMFRAILEIEE